jgi:hypothetical protein
MPTEQSKQNPFALLRVSIQTPRQDIVKLSKELIDQTDDKERQLAYRKAVEQIISHPFNRLVYAAWEMPDTDYDDHDQAWESFAKRFRANPITLDSLHPAADIFAAQNFHPDKLIKLLSPLLKVSRPNQQRVLGLSAPATDDLRVPLNSNELF